jgi:hypothetical protein
MYASGLQSSLNRAILKAQGGALHDKKEMADHWRGSVAADCHCVGGFPVVDSYAESAARGTPGEKYT